MRLLAAALLTISSTLAMADEKRPMPDYDGRGPKPTTAGDVALWVPRVIFSPAYLVSEFGLRRPLGWLITNAERQRWAQALVSFFTFGDSKAGLVPTALIEFGFRPSVGLYFFWDEAIWKENQVRIHASTWGPDWVMATFTDRVKVGHDSFIGLRTEWIRRKDLVFHGLGPRSLEDDRGRYGSTRFDFGPRWDLRIGPHARLETGIGFRDVLFQQATCCDDPSVGEQFVAGRYALPPGFVDGYTGGYERMSLAVDSRREAEGTDTGVRAQASVEHGTDLRSTLSNWIRYEGTVAGYWNFWAGRTLGLSFHGAGADGDFIPFTEQILLGGTGVMRGFRPGRLVGRSAAALTLSYEWPIWIWLNGAMHVAIGNVFDRAFVEFSPSLFRLSSGIGVRTTGKRDHRFEILAGLGTETFEQGAKITSFRLVFGATRGF
jgi:hypothetical protein